MSAALHIVPQAEVIGEGAPYDHAVDFLRHVSAIGEAWSSQVGGFGGLHLSGKKTSWIARWGSSHDKVGCGLDPAAACLDLATKLARDLKDWSRDDEENMAPALEASISLLKLDAMSP